ncbi:MAG: hypothetical protein GXP45_01210 [bacterium]|nr:hypothetical protein [bacterium]
MKSVNDEMSGMFSSLSSHSQVSDSFQNVAKTTGEQLIPFSQSNGAITSSGVYAISEEIKALFGSLSNNMNIEKTRGKEELS